jgi:glycosyltransferase involved in cell wall biosynthesis
MSAKVGLVHDYLLVMRGAERTFAELAELYPTAPIYTTLYSERGTEGRFAGRRVRTSRLQWLGLRQRGFRRLLPLFPAAVERLPVAEHALVVSSSSAFALGVRPGPDAVHVCYCHTPFRYAWHERDRALAEVRAPLRKRLDRTLERIRRWDVAASRRVDSFVANSELTRERIAAAYERPATVVHPPVELDRFQPAEPGDYFLCVTELVPHKRVELALEAARRVGVRLVVVGTGPELRRLRALYGPERGSGVSAEFRGRVGDRELANLYAGCRATVVTAVEEFGIVAVEAQAAGRPVLAPAGGGAAETVIDGETGVLVEEAGAGELAEVLATVDFGRFDPAAARRSAERFSPTAFRGRMREVIARARRLG